MIELFGVELLPDWPTFLAFALGGLALNLVPGADMAFVIAASARGGARHGIIAALGISAGALAHVLAAVLGLSAILLSSQVAFTIVKLAGAAYLLWIAISLVRQSARLPQGQPSPVVSRARVFRSAALVNATNPKVALFFLAFLPQFVSPDAIAPGMQILCLGIWFNLVGTLVNVVIAIVVAKGAIRLRAISWMSKTAKWFAAAVLGGLAVKLALSSRN